MKEYYFVGDKGYRIYYRDDYIVDNSYENNFENVNKYEDSHVMVMVITITITRIILEENRVNPVVIQIIETITILIKKNIAIVRNQ